ncbi:hypothetical protein VTN02DRAFT_3935 [Thermoascus thermophilus]
MFQGGRQPDMLIPKLDLPRLGHGLKESVQKKGHPNTVNAPVRAVQHKLRGVREIMQGGQRAGAEASNEILSSSRLGGDHKRLLQPGVQCRGIRGLVDHGGAAPPSGDHWVVMPHRFPCLTQGGDPLFQGKIYCRTNSRGERKMLAVSPILGHDNQFDAIQGPLITAWGDFFPRHGGPLGSNQGGGNDVCRIDSRALVEQGWYRRLYRWHVVPVFRSASSPLAW